MAHPRRTLLACVAVLTLSWAAPAGAEDTINVPGPLSPRELSVTAETDPDQVRLTDRDGRDIPLTGEGTRLENGTLTVFPPKLPEGTYTLSHPGGSETFAVGDATPERRAEQGTFPLWAVPAALLLLGIALLATRRRRVGALVVAIAAISTVVPAMLPSRLDPGAADPCSNIEAWETRIRCMLDHMQDAVEAGGVEAAVDRLEALVSGTGSRWGVACHEVAHYLGQISLKETTDVERLVDAGTLSCSFGYFHGLLEALGTYSTDEDFPETAFSVCARLEERFEVAAEDGSARECAHGIGHAAMWRHNENLLAARPVCDDLTETSWREQCDAGAVMSWVFARESARTGNRPQDAPEPTVTKPLDLCSPPFGTPNSGCIDGALSGTLRGEYDDSLAWCRENPEYSTTCAASLGRRLMFWEVEGNFDAAGEARRLCLGLHGEGDGRQRCMSEIVWMHLHVLRDYPQTETFCRDVGAEFSSGCREGILLFYETMLRRGDGSSGEIPPDVLEELQRGR